MSDAISNYGRMTQSNASVRSTIEKSDKKSSSTAQAQDVASSKSANTGTDQVSLSNVAQKVMDQPGFDRSKVESIKQAIQSGNYPINPREIAESFVSFENLLSN